MDTVVFIIYIISLISVAVCLWVKWDQDEDKHKAASLERKQKELEFQIETLTQQLKRLGVKDPFSGQK